jgi:hypothetical protein
LSAAGGSGTRARTREIGYAEAMAEMSELLSVQAGRWQGTADQQLSPEFHAALTVAAREMRQLADYAHGAAQVHGTGRLMSLNEFMFEVYWQPLPGEQVPAELPQREQSENN